jgi:hypothetical protein
LVAIGLGIDRGVGAVGDQRRLKRVTWATGFSAEEGCE